MFENGNRDAWGVRSDSCERQYIEKKGEREREREKNRKFEPSRKEIKIFCLTKNTFQEKIQVPSVYSNHFAELFFLQIIKGIYFWTLGEKTKIGRKTNKTIHRKINVMARFEGLDDANFDLWKSPRLRRGRINLKTSWDFQKSILKNQTESQ